MTHSPHSRPDPTQDIDSVTTVSETSQIEAILGALKDEDCRAILAATSDGTRTANELSESCDLALSTAYRKLDQLTETGLLDEQLRISRNGKHTSEYARSIENLHVSMGTDIELSVTHRHTEQGGQSAVAGAD